MPRANLTNLGKNSPIQIICHVGNLAKIQKCIYPGLFSGGVYYYRYINTKLLRFKKKIPDKNDLHGGCTPSALLPRICH